MTDNTFNDPEIIIITTDREAFGATGLVFEEAHKLQLTNWQIDVIKTLEEKGHVITKIVLSHGK